MTFELSALSSLLPALCPMRFALYFLRPFPQGFFKTQ